MEKTFADGGKIAKFVKIFSLESFPLYGKSMFAPPKMIIPSWPKVVRLVADGKDVVAMAVAMYHIYVSPFIADAVRSKDFPMATHSEHAHYMIKWCIRHTHSLMRRTPTISIKIASLELALEMKRKVNTLSSY